MGSVIGAMRQGNQLKRKAAGTHLGQDSDVGRDRGNKQVRFGKEADTLPCQNTEFLEHGLQDASDRVQQ